MPEFEILKYRPAYGPLPPQIGATGKAYREGLFVQFKPDNGPGWIGNFAKGLGGLSTAVKHPNDKAVIVIANGEGYIVNPDTREVEEMGSSIQQLIDVPEYRMMIIVDPFTIEALGENGSLWKTHRISVEGIRNIHITGTALRGEVSDLSGDWLPFWIDIMTGKKTGGLEPFTEVSLNHR